MKSSVLNGTLRSKNYYEQIVDRVVAGIFSGELRPGTRLPSEEEFAARIGVGRNAVREAMNILKAFGIVEIRRAEGIFIAEEYNKAMLNPLICGMLLCRKDADQLADMKVRMQGMLLCALSEHGNEEHLRECLREINGHISRMGTGIEEQCIFIEKYEEKLLLAGDDRITAQLFSSIRALCQALQQEAVRRKYDTGNERWFPVLYRDMTDALLKKDRNRIRFLLRSEYNALRSAA